MSGDVHANRELRENHDRYYGGQGEDVWALLSKISGPWFGGGWANPLVSVSDKHAWTIPCSSGGRAARRLGLTWGRNSAKAPAVSHGSEGATPSWSPLAEARRPPHSEGRARCRYRILKANGRRTEAPPYVTASDPANSFPWANRGILQTQLVRPRRNTFATAAILRLPIRAVHTTLPDLSGPAVSLRDTLIAAANRLPAFGIFGVVVNRVTVSVSGARGGPAAGGCGGGGAGGCGGGGGAGTGLSIAIAAVAAL
jgi:hypothetical protein